MVQIKTFDQYNQLVDRYNRKGRITNDYIQNEAADLIIHDRMFAVCGQDNALLLVQREGFYRVYYYINNTEERLELPKEELVTEILFRGENAPEAEVKWLEGMGLKKNLVRDQYFAKYASLSQPILIEGVKIEIATTIDDILWAIRLFNASFDKWSGDYIPEAQAPLLIQENAILIAKDLDGSRLGALQFELRQGACWLNHVAVVPEARGKKIGRGLTEAYIEQGHVDDNSRYMLWVQRQNESAVAMYRNKGFAPMNKSTLSMIKL
jgi:GNAT superfamily N-acetyltransferase